MDQTQRVNATTTVAAHAFYNGYGQLAETRDQAPGGQDVVRFTEFDAATRAFRVSNPYFVPAWDGVTGFGDSADDVNQVPTTSSYDGLGRTLTTTDPLYNVTTTSYGVTCNVTWSGGSDSSCYAATSVTDANAHQSQSFTDAFGRTTYTRDLSGNGGSVPYATYRTIAATYDYAGNETTITQPNGSTQSTTTFGYDAAGRQVWMTDPDRGHESYAYDADSNVVTVTDARNESVYAGYDGLNRQVWRNTLDTPNNAYLSYDYDQSGHGASIGRLTSEQFVSPSDATDSSLTGSYSYTYDARGQVTNTTTTLLGATYPTSTTYDDAGEPLSVTYPDGTGPVASMSYSQGWLTGVSWTEGATTTPILAAVSYSGPAGAFGAITSANVGQNAGAALYRYFGQLDRDGRLVADELVKINTGAMLYDEQIHYDPVGNVAAVTTVLPAGTDNQIFCYDEQNRLTWAGTTTGNPCGNAGATGTFGTAGYTQSFSYDTLNRLTNSSAGNYTYGDSAHLHGVTSVSGGNGAYSASYDASGNMTCRAPSSSSSCAGTPKTGQALTWDVEGRLATWQNTTTAPTVTTKYLYDGEGNRVVQQVVDSTAGTTTTTTTSYIGSLETHTMTAVSGGPTSITSIDYIPAGKLLAVASNGTLSYLATSYQGSIVEALDSTGAAGVTASQLYVPYGGIRSQSGTLPTDEGYTGQRRDASTGLDYYGARYYDPTVGQFTSADTVLAGGLNRYGYVGGNPTTATDPSGHMDDEDSDEGAATGTEGMTPEAMSGDVSPGGDAVVGDGTVSPVNPVIDDSPQYITDDNGQYAGDTVTLEGTPGDGTATIHEGDGDTDTESQSDFWETQGPVDNLDEPTEMGSSAYTAQEQENQQSPTTPTTPTSENPDNPGNDGPHAPPSSTPDPQDLVNQAENARTENGTTSHAAGVAANINGNSTTNTSGNPTEPYVDGDTTIGDKTDRPQCAECNFFKNVARTFGRGGLKGQTVTVGVSQAIGKMPCGGCIATGGQAATYTGATFELYWGPGRAAAPEEGEQPIIIRP